MKLNGKRALVTGGSKGICAAIARRLAAAGAEVVINFARSAKEAEALAKAIRSSGGKCSAIQADLSNAAEASAIVSRAAVAAGGPIDILVNNAGVYGFRPVENLDEAFIDWLFDLNVKAVLLAIAGSFNKPATVERL